jgi:hypothetical protein
MRRHCGDNFCRTAAPCIRGKTDFSNFQCRQAEAVSARLKLCLQIKYNPVHFFQIDAIHSEFINCKTIVTEETRSLLYAQTKIKIVIS